MSLMDIIRGENSKQSDKRYYDIFISEYGQISQDE